MNRTTTGSLPAARPRPGRTTSIVRWAGGSSWVLRGLALIALLVAWQVASQLMGQLLMPSPARTVDSFAELITTGELADAWSETLFIMAVGLGSIAVLGIGLGMVLGRFRLADTFLDPVLTGLFMLPKLALVPIVALWLGYQEPAKIVYIFLFGFFEVLFVVRNGVRSMEAEYVEVARSYVVPERTMLLKIILPASIPFVITGLRLGLLRGIEGAVIAGFFFESNGVGGLIFNAGVSFQPEILFAGLATVAAVGITINLVLHAAERRVAPWAEVSPT
jgi:ABC-type nitrate/sulfonate/bicarbonate transport system permease component